MEPGELDSYPLTGRFLMGRLRHGMSAEEKQTIEDLIEQVEELPTAATILARGEYCDRSTMLIDGFVLRAIQQGGRRYVVGVQVPGDFVDLHAFALKRLDHDIVTVGPAKVGYVSHARLLDVMKTAPHLARLLWFSTLLDAAIHREWIVAMEHLPAPARAAHVFCELWHRLEFVGLAGTDGIETPLIQADLADMCGTTAIHMNRALTQMRRDVAGDFRRGVLRAPDRAGLEAFARFDPAYLYGQGELRLTGDLTDGFS
jgi:CRP-like cAMP-binding protein